MRWGLETWAACACLLFPPNLKRGPLMSASCRCVEHTVWACLCASAVLRVLVLWGLSKAAKEISKRVACW